MDNKTTSSPNDGNRQRRGEAAAELAYGTAAFRAAPSAPIARLAHDVVVLVGDGVVAVLAVVVAADARGAGARDAGQLAPVVAVFGDDQVAAPAVAPRPGHRGDRGDVTGPGPGVDPRPRALGRRRLVVFGVHALGAAVEAAVGGPSTKVVRALLVQPGSTGGTMTRTGVCVTSDIRTRSGSGSGSPSPSPPSPSPPPPPPPLPGQPLDLQTHFPAASSSGVLDSSSSDGRSSPSFRSPSHTPQTLSPATSPVLVPSINPEQLRHHEHRHSDHRHDREHRRDHHGRSQHERHHSEHYSLESHTPDPPPTPAQHVYISADKDRSRRRSGSPDGKDPQDHPRNKSHERKKSNSRHGHQDSPPLSEKDPSGRVDSPSSETSPPPPPTPNEDTTSPLETAHATQFKSASPSNLIRTNKSEPIDTPGAKNGPAHSLPIGPLSSSLPIIMPPSPSFPQNLLASSANSVVTHQPTPTPRWGPKTPRVGLRPSSGSSDSIQRHNRALARNTIQRLTFSLTVYKTSLLTIKFISGINIRGPKGKLVNAFCVVSAVDPQAPSPPPSGKKNTNKTDCLSEDNTWDEEISLEIPPAAETVKIEVKGHRKLQKDELVGIVDIPVYRLHDFPTPTVIPIQPCKDSKASGEIEIICNFVTALERNEDLRITRQNYDALHSILIDPNLLMITRLCTALQKKCDDSMGIAIVRLFNKDNLALPLVVNMISDEITRNVHCSSTLLRGDTVSTRLCAFYCKYIGYQYLMNTIVPHINSILDETNCYEVDPALASPEDNLQENALHLVSLCSDIVNSIISSVSAIPRNIKVVLCQLRNFMEEISHPELAPVVTVAIFFLRYITPAILFPEQNSLTDREVSPEARRMLMLVTKVIQGLANPSRQQEEAHEPAMELILPQIKHLRPAMEQLITELSASSSSGGPDEPHSHISDEDYPLFMSIVLRKIADNRKDLETAITTPPFQDETVAAKIMKDYGILNSIILEQQKMYS
ncbi:RasGTPase-activating protein [Pelomyxa schiedti]|nr:RasGTPase-activating protein [Pelomyxa schiedti]